MATKTYALADAYSTGTQPPSGPNHWWLFSAQSASGSQQQSYPAAGGTQVTQYRSTVGSTTSTSVAGALRGAINTAAAAAFESVS